MSSVTGQPPALSIITPSFNQGRFITATIQSVLTQNIPDLEYVVVDGGSNDSTVSILKEFSSALRWISETDRGQAHAVNKGFALTTGAIIGWLNSDDIYYPNACKTVLDFFAAHPNVDVVYGRANHIDEVGKILDAYPTRPWNLPALKQDCFIAQPAVFFRRALLEKFGVLNENLNYCLDYEFWLRLGLGGACFAYLPQVLAATRLYPETKTLGAPLKFQQEILKMLQERLGVVPSLSLINYAIAQVKSNHPAPLPKLKFLTLVLSIAIHTSFQCNGVLYGMISCLTLPQAMLRKYFNKKHSQRNSISVGI